MKKLVCFAIMMAFSLSSFSKIERPKLVVGLVVDQMRWDYLSYYYDKYGEDGFKRLLNEGYSFDNTLINYIPTVTAIGHTSVYTGTVPSLHGIAGNYFVINDKATYCCNDTSVKSIGSNSKEGQMSPRNLLATTIGDVLKISNDFKSKVIGVALKDRAAILPAGHSADAAYWWDTSAGHFVSSSYYMDKLPEWVEKFNKENHTKPKFNIRESNLGVDMTFKMALAALRNEQLGKHDVTDMLTVSISSTDAIGHSYSTRGKENEEVFMTLDKGLSEFLKALDNEVGKGNYLLFLTADHGAAHNYNYMQNHKIPAGGWNYKKTVKELNAHLQEKFGKEKIVMFEDNYQMYLNDSLIASAGIEKEKVVKEAVDFLEQDDDFLYVIDNKHATESVIPARIKEMLINGYNHKRSGEITVVPRAGYFGVSKPSPDYKGTSHGEWNPYDAHIPFILMGWNVPNGSSNEPTHIVDIAPTICAMLHIQMPNSCIGDAKTVKINH